jgi:hypothetical protein
MVSFSPSVVRVDKPRSLGGVPRRFGLSAYFCASGNALSKA